MLLFLNPLNIKLRSIAVIDANVIPEANTGSNSFGNIPKNKN